MMVVDIKKLCAFSVLVLLLVISLLVSCNNASDDSDITDTTDAQTEAQQSEETTAEGKKPIITKPKDTSKPQATDTSGGDGDTTGTTEPSIPAYVPDSGIGAEVDWEEGTT